MRVRKPSPAVVRLIVFAGALAAVLTLVIALRDILFPLFLALAIAYVADPAVNWFERRGRSRSAGTFAIALLLVLLATGFFLYLIPAIGAQVRHLEERLPQYAARIRGQLLPWLAGLEQRFPKQYAEIQVRARAALSEQMPRIAGDATAWLGHVLGSLMNLVLFLLDLVFVPVFAFYLLVDLPKIKRKVRELIPLPYREVVLARMHELDAAISSFVRGQLTIAAILAVIDAVGLMLLGVPLGLVLGLLAGLANIVPYMSLVVGVVPALLLSWAEDQSPAKLLGVVGIFAGGHLLEGMFLSPRILSKSVDLHPVWVLLSIIVGGSLFGLFGMVLAVPTAAAIQVFLRHGMESYRRSRIYQGDGLPEEPGPPVTIPPIPQVLLAPQGDRRVDAGGPARR
jgi:predicted PurR-regulated permease PerM